MALSVGTISTEIDAETSSLTWSHTVSGSDPLLIVVVRTRDSGTAANVNNPSGITYGGNALTKAVEKLKNNGYEENDEKEVGVSIWYLVAPAAGSASIVVSGLDSNDTTHIGKGVTINGAHQTSPIHATASSSASGSASSVSLSVSSETGQLVLDAVEEAGYTESPGGSQTEITTSVSTKAAAAGSTSMSWSLSGGGIGDIIAQVAVSIKPATGGGGGGSTPRVFVVI